MTRAQVYPADSMCPNEVGRAPTMNGCHCCEPKMSTSEFGDNMRVSEKFQTDSGSAGKGRSGQPKDA